MPTYLSDSWQIGGYANETFNGDRYEVVRNDVFQLAGNESGTVGGVNNGWDSFFGGGGNDRIYVAPKSGYWWTAVMIDNYGLKGVETIHFNTSGPKPIYFAGTVNFGDVVSMTPDAKIFGRANDNTFYGGTLGEYVEGDDGNDTLYGNGGDDKLYGDTTTENPWAANYNAAGNDTLVGGAGDDELYGQGGNDILNGNSGTNVHTGGGGADMFRFTNHEDHSTIMDFSAGVDKIQIDTSIASDFTSLNIENNNGSAVITDGNVKIIVSGVLSASLTSADFMFGDF